ncbi:MAG: hypothetical protein OXC11_00735 [Rhodospirillales bacterium]|nr:hypothetical protein [Rhodospirillales bacterium]
MGGMRRSEPTGENPQQYRPPTSGEDAHRLLSERTTIAALIAERFPQLRQGDSGAGMRGWDLAFELEVPSAGERPVLQVHGLARVGVKAAVVVNYGRVDLSVPSLMMDFGFSRFAYDDANRMQLPECVERAAQAMVDGLSAEFVRPEA